MAIDIKTAWEQDRNGNLFAPRTLVESIQNAEGKSLQELLDEKSGGGSSAIQTDILLTDGIYREGEYSLLHSIDDYDFILVAAYTYSDTTGQNSVIQSQLIAKHDYYYYPASGKDGTSFTITGTMNEHDRRVLFCFLDSTTIKIKATTTPSVIKTIYGINIKTSTPINNKVSTVVSYAAEPQTTPVTLHGHIQFNTVVLDTANCWDAEDYSFVTPIDGIYNINFCCYVSSSTTLNRVAIETKHGDEIWKTRAVANGYNNGASINLNWYLEKNDRVRLTTGGDSYYVTFYPISNHNTFSIALLGGGLSTGDLINVDDELSDTSTNPVQNKVITKKLDEVFQSVSSGKKKIAAAITDKGVETAADATFDIMADNIANIPSGGGSVETNEIITQWWNTLSNEPNRVGFEQSYQNDIITVNNTNVKSRLFTGNYYGNSSYSFQSYVLDLHAKRNSVLFVSEEISINNDIQVCPFVFAPSLDYLVEGGAHAARINQSSSERWQTFYAGMPFFSLGLDNTKPKPNNYTISPVDVTNYQFSTITMSSTSNSKTGGYDISFTINIDCINDFNFSEIGLFKPLSFFRYSLYGGYPYMAITIDPENVLVYRKVFKKPIELKAGDNYQLELTISFGKSVGDNIIAQVQLNTPIQCKTINSTFTVYDNSYNGTYTEQISLYKDDELIETADIQDSYGDRIAIFTSELNEGDNVNIVASAQNFINSEPLSKILTNSDIKPYHDSSLNLVSKGYGREVLFNGASMNYEVYSYHNGNIDYFKPTSGSNKYDFWTPLIGCQTKWDLTKTSYDKDCYQVWDRLLYSTTVYPKMNAPASFAKTITMYFRGGNYTNNWTINSLKFYVDGEETSYSLQQLVAKKVIEPMVLMHSEDTGNHNFANFMNLYTGGSSGVGNYPNGYILFMLNAGHSIDKTYISSSKDTSTSYADGIAFSWFDRRIMNFTYKYE